MRTSQIDALLKLSALLEQDVTAVRFHEDDRSTAATVRLFAETPQEGSKLVWAHILLASPLDLKWGDRFTLTPSHEKGTLGEGQVLNPDADVYPRTRTEKRISLLKQMMGSWEAALKAVLRDRGIQGMTEKEITDRFHFSPERIVRWSQEGEAEGMLKILSFSPLLLISMESFEFLGEKIIAFLELFHKNNPGQIGMSLEKLFGRFTIHPKILQITLGYLIQEERIREREGYFALREFTFALSPEEESLLLEMEELARRGEFKVVSWEEMKKRFYLSDAKLDMLISLLIERRKVVLGRDGYLLHSQWLESLIKKIRASGKSELSVGEFKGMTGLSRKYAIPLLELLDQMGVTRRQGQTRIILKE